MRFVNTSSPLAAQDTPTCLQHFSFSPPRETAAPPTNPSHQPTDSAEELETLLTRIQDWCARGSWLRGTLIFASTLALISAALPRWTEAQAPTVTRSGVADFVLSPGDRLRISVWPDSTLSGEFPIEESGFVHLPLLGAVEAARKTVDVLRQELREGYERELQLPVVSLTALFRVSILGGVRFSGVYWVEPSYGLFELISEAGGFTQDAQEDKMIIIRASGESYQIDAARLREAASAESLMRLNSGDRLVVPEDPGFNWSIFLQTLTLVGVIVSIAVR